MATNSFCGSDFATSVRVQDVHGSAVRDVGEAIAIHGVIKESGLLRRISFPPVGHFLTVFIAGLKTTQVKDFFFLWFLSKFIRGAINMGPTHTERMHRVVAVFLSLLS